MRVSNWTSAFLLAIVTLVAAPAFSQSLTGAITGRALDGSGAVLPGVDVTISSPAMIGGARSAVTDAQGVYRFTQLPSGEYRVSFKLSGFKTLNVEAVRLDVGATMTINGTLQIDALSEEVTVISETPVIDLQSTTVGVNWDEKQMENLPYGRGVRGLARLVPGLTPTQFDVGGNTVGGSTTTGARSYGRNGDELIKFDGVVWDQFFGDYNTYEQVQISAAAKGAESQSPGATLSFVIKSGGNKFSGMYLLAWQDGAFQGNNVTQELRAKGFDPGNNKFTRYNDISLDLGGPILRDKLWFYGAYGYNYSGLFIPGFISEETGEQVEYFTRLDNPTIKLTYQMNQNNKFELSQQYNRKWQPYRNASRFVPLEASQNQIAWTAIGPAAKWTHIVNQSQTFDVGFNRSGYWWPDYAWTDDVRAMDLTTTQTRGAFLELRREPVRWGYNGTYSWFTNLKGMNHELKSGFLGYSSTNYVETYGYPNQQIYRYRSLRERHRSVRAARFGAGLRLSEQHQRRRQLQLVVRQRHDHAVAQGDAQRRPALRSLRLLAARAGQPGHGPVRGAQSLSRESRLPGLQRVVAAAVVHLRPHRQRPRRAQGQLRPLRGVRIRRQRRERPDRQRGQSGDGTHDDLSLDRRHSVCAERRRSAIGERRTRRPPPRPEPQAGRRGRIHRRRRPRRQQGPHGSPERRAQARLGRQQGARSRAAVRSLHRSPHQRRSRPRQRGRHRRRWRGQVWSVPRSYPTFGQVIRLTTNTDSNEGEDKYRAFETTASRRYANGWSLLASYSIDRRDPRNINPRNPNEAAYRAQSTSGAISTDFPPEIAQTYQGIRLSGTYELPWKMLVASTFTGQQGEYFPRIVQAPNALNTLVEVVVEGQAGRYDWVKLMDLRMSKTFTFGRHSFEGMFDVFNLTNTSVILRQVIVNGPNYLKPLATGGIDAASANPIPAPRIFRLSARYRF